MEFNITHLDKILLIQTLYIHADPKGYGEIQYRDLLKQGKTVEGLPENECQEILDRKQQDGGFLVDYYNGKPLKLDWIKMPGKQLHAYSLSYDIAHGKYRFFEALLNVFDPEEILVSKKQYDSVLEELYFKKEDTRIIEYELAQILEYTIPVSYGTGTYWKVDPDVSGYRSSFLNGLDI